MKKSLATAMSVLPLLSLALAHAQVSKPIRWVTIGNSITFGTGTNPGTVGGGATSYTNGYPYRLAARLGPAFLIENDGINSMQVIKSGNHPYWTQARLPQAFAFQPDIVTVKLGTNDSKPINWDDSVSFVKDYTAFIDTLKGMNSHPQVWSMLPVWCGQTEIWPPVWTDTSTHYETWILGSIIPKIQQVAAAESLNVVDLHTPMLNKTSLYISDKLHPNNAGADTIAAVIYRTFLSKVKRVANIGNGITSYVGTVSGAAAIDAHPIKLNMLLGRGYYVRNLGVTGTSVMRADVDVPTLTSYWSQKTKLDSLFAYKPHLVILNFGTDESRPKIWNTAKFIAAYGALIDTIRTIAPQPEIRIAKPLPVFQVGGQWPASLPGGSTDNGVNGNTITDSVLPALAVIAQAKGVKLIDLNTPFQSLQSTQADGLYPNSAGQDTIAHIEFRSITTDTALVTGLNPKASGRPAGAASHAAVRLTPDRNAGSERLYSPAGRSAASGEPVAAGVYFSKPATAKAPEKTGKKVEEKK
jgi:lysophospholipase L1-like esterase